MQVILDKIVLFFNVFKGEKHVDFPRKSEKHLSSHPTTRESDFAIPRKHQRYANGGPEANVRRL